MNRRDYFLACLNVHLNRSSESKVEITAVQAEAWRIPEEAIPAINPAQAALDFYDFHFGSDVAKPLWLAAWEESLGR